MSRCLAVLWASLVLDPSSSQSEDCECLPVGSEAGSCGSVVSRLVLASYDAEMCLDELRKRKSVEQDVGYYGPQ